MHQAFIPHHNPYRISIQALKPTCFYNKLHTAPIKPPTAPIHIPWKLETAEDTGVCVAIVFPLAPVEVAVTDMDPTPPDRVAVDEAEDEADRLVVAPEPVEREVSIDSAVPYTFR
jgi:hypothetical protein